MSVVHSSSVHVKVLNKLCMRETEVKVPCIKVNMFKSGNCDLCFAFFASDVFNSICVLCTYNGLSSIFG